ncbi:hypothetical protein DIS24_g5290 [Lasiodiplodia hormozganensis]|uniref:Uncharacterized protein n=1 Tax=Lasiodiplodia hormozganensis TaxID=869390 RepID=A0AA39YLX7_9PEZI|nr:hypothetical protein DIS24_g5290 [Lasiodiplodia hormozganensis]
MFLLLLLAVASSTYLPHITRRPPSFSSPTHASFFLVCMAFGLLLVSFFLPLVADAGASFFRSVMDEVNTRLFASCPACVELVPLPVTRYRTRTEPPSPPAKPMCDPPLPAPPPFMTGCGILKVAGRRPPSPATPARKNCVAFSPTAKVHEYSYMKSILRPTRSSHFEPDDSFVDLIEDPIEIWVARLQVSKDRKVLRFDPAPQIELIGDLRYEKWRGPLMDEVEEFDRSLLRRVKSRDLDGDVEMD